MSDRCVTARTAEFHYKRIPEWQRPPDNGLERVCWLMHRCEFTPGAHHKFVVRLHHRMTEEAMK